MAAGQAGFGFQRIRDQSSHGPKGTTGHQRRGRHPEILGIGIDEDAALVVRGSRFK
jgi:hypothetical protein